MRPSALAFVLIACGTGNVTPDASTDPSADVPASSFPAIATTAGRAEYSFMHAGITRTFLLYIPSNYTHSDPRPLMVSLHGGGGSAQQMFGQHPLESYADQTGYIMIAAQGTPSGAGGYDWNAHASLDTGAEDVGYLETVIVGISAALKIDPARRYVAGFSGGASMTIRFAAEKSQYVAAIGTFAGKVGVAAGSTPPFLFPQIPMTPVSVQLKYGTLDDNYTGGLKDGHLFTSGKEGITWFAMALGCGATPTTDVNNKLTFDTYTGCTSGAVVRMITVEGMRHMWPDKSDGLDGTKLLLDFFKDKSKP